MKYVLNDMSNYEAGMANDGGKYGFSTVFTEVANNLYKVSYHTTSHLDYCSKCGEWHDERTCNKDYEIISGKEVRKKVNDFTELYHDDDRCFVEII